MSVETGNTRHITGTGLFDRVGSLQSAFGRQFRNFLREQPFFRQYHSQFAGHFLTLSELHFAPGNQNHVTTGHIRLQQPEALPQEASGSVALYSKQTVFSGTYHSATGHAVG